MTKWETIAKQVEKDYGTQVDWDERFFICPNAATQFTKMTGLMMNQTFALFVIFHGMENLRIGKILIQKWVMTLTWVVIQTTANAVVFFVAALTPGSARNFHYTTRRAFCQQENRTKFSSYESQNQCKITT